DQYLIDEVSEVQKIFKQMEMAVKQHSATKTEFQTKMENVLKENDRLLTHALGVDIVNIVRDTVSSSESAPIFAELFETNELKAQIQEKDTVILKLKEKIKSSSADDKERKVECKVEDIKTQNLELDHRVTKLTAENNHLKQTYKQLFDSIKSSRVQSKEQCDDLINKVNLKSVEVTDLNASLQEKVMVITALKEQLKGKAVLPKAVSLNPLDPALLQVRRTLQITKSEKPFVDTSTSPNIDSNTPVLSSTGVALVSSASGSQSKDNTKKNRIRRTLKKAKETELEDHHRKVKSSLNKASVVASRATYINSVNASRKSKSAKKPINRKVWKTTGKVFKTVGYKWTPTGRTFTLVGNVCPLTRIATATIVPPRKLIPIIQSTDKPVVTLVYTRKPRAKNVVQIVLWYLDSGCSKHMTEDRSQLINFVQKFLGTVKFRNDHVAKIMGYGEYQIGNVTISRVYYVEGLGHNLFSVGQFCDSDLEVAFRQHTCFIRNLEGVDLLTGSQGNNLYTLSLQDMMASSPICLFLRHPRPSPGFGIAACHI
nr:integrase, catalytic region, zinc finger, CCHC-type, peptidase aspartic, catalytic [Tanacetum cinerariifolium]